MLKYILEANLSVLCVNATNTTCGEVQCDKSEYCVVAWLLSVSPLQIKFAFFGNPNLLVLLFFVDLYTRTAPFRCPTPAFLNTRDSTQLVMGAYSPKLTVGSCGAMFTAIGLRVLCFASRSEPSGPSSPRCKGCRSRCKDRRKRRR